MLTTEVGGRGGVQYAGRLILQALTNQLDRDLHMSVVTVKDQTFDGVSTGNGSSFIGGGGSRLRTGLNAMREWRRDAWDLLVLGHINLASLPALLNRSRRCPTLAIVYSLEAWQPISWLRRAGLRRTDRLLYISEHSRARSHEANPWLEEIPNAVCHLGLMEEGGDSGQRSAISGQVSGVSGQVSGVSGQVSAISGQPSALGSQLSALGSQPSPLAPRLSPLPPLPSPLAPRPSSFALSIGRMSRSEGYKGHEEMIRVWPRVESVRGEFPLVIIGEGDDRARLEQLARETGANVRFLGAVDDQTRDEYLDRCTCFCLPARGEGFGLVYLEAMRAGKPVLAGSRDAGREVVVDRVTGRTVDPTSPDELVAGILDVSGDQAETMGQAGRERFQQHFTFEKFGERFGKHLREVVAKRD